MKKLFATVILFILLLPAISSQSSPLPTSVYAGHMQTGGAYCPGECSSAACGTCGQSCGLGLRQQSSEQKEDPISNKPADKSDLITTLLVVTLVALLIGKLTA